MNNCSNPQNEFDKYAELTGYATNYRISAMGSDIIKLIVKLVFMVIVMVIILFGMIMWKTIDNEPKVITKTVTKNIIKEVCPKHHICIDEDNLNIIKIKHKYGKKWTYTQTRLNDRYYYITYVEKE